MIRARQRDFGAVGHFPFRLFTLRCMHADTSLKLPKKSLQQSANSMAWSGVPVSRIRHALCVSSKAWNKEQNNLEKKDLQLHNSLWGSRTRNGLL